MKATEIGRLNLTEYPSYLTTLLPDRNAAVTRLDGSLQLHCVSNKHPIPLLKQLLSRPAPLSVSHLGSRVVWSDGAHRLFTATPEDTTSTELKPAPYHQNGLCFSLDARFVAAAGSALTRERDQYEREMSVYEAGEPYDYGEYRPSVRPDPGLGPGHVRLWELATGRSALFEGFRETASGPTLNEDGSLLAAFDRHSLRVWEVASTRSLIETPTPTRYQPQTMQFSSDGACLMVGDAAGLWRYHLASARVEQVLVLDPRDNTRPAFDGAGRLSAVGYERGVICLYDNLSGAEVGVVPISAPSSRVALSTAGTSLSALVGNMLISWRLD